MMVIVGYAETVKLHGVLKNREVKSNILLNIVFLLSKSSFFAGSVLFNKDMMASISATEARKKGIDKSLKTKFKEEAAYPLWLDWKKRGFERGSKSNLVKTLIDLYELEVKKAGRKINPSERTLSERTVWRWIEDFEKRKSG